MDWSPVYGGFQGSEGLFEGYDTYDGKPIKVRFQWRKLSLGSARWGQDSIMDFKLAM